MTGLVPRTPVAVEPNGSDLQEQRLSLPFGDLPPDTTQLEPSRQEKNTKSPGQPRPTRTFPGKTTDTKPGLSGECDGPHFSEMARTSSMKRAEASRRPVTEGP